MVQPIAQKPSHPHSPPGKPFYRTLTDGVREPLTRGIAVALVARYLFWALWAVGCGLLIDAHHAPAIMVVGACGYTATAVLSTYLGLRGPRAAEAGVRAGLLQALWGCPEYVPPAAGAGADVALMTHDVEKFANNRYGFQGQLVAAVAGPLAVLAFMAIAVDWVTALAIGMVLPLAPLAIGWFHTKFRADAGASRRMRAQLAARFTVMVRGLETVVLCGAGDHIHSQLVHAWEGNRRATMRLLARNQLVLFVSEAVFALAATALTVVVAAWRHAAGAISMGDAVALVLASIVLTTPMQLLGGFFYIGMTGRAAEEAMRRFRARMRWTPAATRYKEEVAEPRVGLRDASIRRGDRTIVTGASFEATPGHPVILRGPSGAGKSSVLAVLSGALGLTEGKA